MRKFRDLPLRVKLMISYVGLAACIVVATLLASRGIEARVTDAEAASLELLRGTSELEAEINAGSEEAFSYALVGDPSEIGHATERLSDAAAMVNRLSNRPDLGPEERAQAFKISSDLHALREASTAMLASGRDPALIPALHARYESALDSTIESVAKFRVLAQRHATDNLHAVRLSADAMVLAFGTLAVLGAIGLGTVLSRRITGPLLALRRAVTAFGNRKAMPRLEVSSSDEIGELTTAFRRMAGDIQRHMEQRLDDLFVSIDELLIICNADGTIASANPACARMTGRNERSLAGIPAVSLFDSGNSPGKEKTPLFQAAHRELDAALRTVSGAQIPVRLSVSRLRGSIGGWVIVARDMTERQRLEAELTQAQKMEAVGRLAGGVAHDFNNMLSIILGYSASLLDDLDPESPLYGPLSEVKRAGERSAELTQQLLAFSRRDTLEVQVLDVNVALDHTAKMIRRLLGEDVAVTLALGEEPCKIALAPGQFEQVVFNLVTNARDAMPGGGTLTIETALVEFEETVISHRGALRSGSYVMLSVTDSGTGMDARVQERIFEPFFTTKDQGKGTGLGLSTVFGIVARAGGHIDVKSEPDRGTTFKLYFPECYEDREPTTARAVPRTRRGSETVLVVEDEEQVRRFVGDVLQRRGYHVLPAADPEQATAVCTAHDEPIHLLLTDVVMPQMNGRQLAERLRAVRPDMQVMYMSGYTDHVVLDRGSSHAGEFFVRKPLVPDVLAKEVRRALDAGIAPSGPSPVSKAASP